MDLDKFTQKAQEAIMGAQSLAGDDPVVPDQDEWRLWIEGTE